MKSKENSKQNSVPPSGAPAVWVGIDVAKETLAVDAGAFFKGEIPHTKKAVGQMVRALKKACPRGSALGFCAEHTGLYGQGLADILRGLGQQVSLVPSQRVRHHALSKGIRAKTDPIDAAVIRDYAEANRPAPTPPPTAVQRRLRDLVRTRNAFVRQRAALKLASGVASDKDAGKALRTAIRCLDRQIGRLDALVREAVESDPATKRLADAVKAIKGVKDVTAAIVVALVPELGTLGRRRAAALCGCAPYPNDSGPKKGRRKTGKGREGLRAALYMPATCALTHDPALKAFYQRLKNGKHKPGNVPHVAVMRKLFVLMDALARTALAAGGGGGAPKAD